MPIRVFHGGRDRIPISYSRDLVRDLRARGNDQVRLVEYPADGHDIFDRDYAEPSLPAWLLGQRRRAAPPSDRPDGSP